MNFRRLVLCSLIAIAALSVAPTTVAQEHNSTTQELNAQEKPDAKILTNLNEEEWPDPTPTATLSHEDIRVKTLVDRTPDESGSLSATISVEIPDAVTYMQVVMPDSATITNVIGFSKVEGKNRVYYDADTHARETSEIDVKIKDTATKPNTFGRSDTSDKLLVADTETWAFIDNPFKEGSIYYRTSNSEAYGPMSGGGGKIEYSMGIKDNGETVSGVAGASYAYFGEYTKYTHETERTKYELVVSKEAEFGRSSPDNAEEIFDILTDTKRDLNIGGSNDKITIYVLPSGGNRNNENNGININFPGQASVAGGQTAFMVRDIADEKIYIHEYVHLRQKTGHTDGFLWFTEASASYYELKLSYDQGILSFSDYKFHLEEGMDYNDNILIEQENSTSPTNYFKGALVLQKIDRDIRASTDGEKSLQDVFKILNKKDDSANLEDFYDAVQLVADQDVLEKAKGYVTERSNLEGPPNGAEYASNFDTHTDPTTGEPRVQVDSNVYVNDKSEPIDTQTETVISPRDDIIVVSEFKNTGSDEISVTSSVTAGEKKESGSILVKPNEITTEEWKKYKYGELLPYTFQFEDLGRKTITVKVGEKTQETFNIKVQHSSKTAPVVPKIIVTPSNPVVGEEVSFSGGGSTIRDVEVDTFSWKIEGAGEASGMFASHSFSDPGNYTVKLEVLTEQGKSYVSTERVVVEAGGSETTNGDDSQTKNGKNPAEEIVSALKDWLT